MGVYGVIRGNSLEIAGASRPYLESPLTGMEDCSIIQPTGDNQIIDWLKTLIAALSGNIFVPA